MGLRVFAQHNLNVPLTYRSHTDPETEKQQANIVIELENVDVMESEVSENRPDGYKKGASYHYDSVDGERIGVENLVEDHYSSALDLVRTMSKHAYEIRGEELEEYSKLEDLMINILSQKEAE